MISFHSIILGFSIAAPVGPIGVWCIERTLRGGGHGGRSRRRWRSSKRRQGVFTGSMWWWVALTTGMSLPPIPMRVANWGAGALLTGLGECAATHSPGGLAAYTFSGTM
jgi:hypothetical protein